MNNIIALHDEYMNVAIDVAKKSYEDVPVGAVLVKEGKIISSFCNLKEKNSDPTGHAEMLVIRDAAKKLGNWRLNHTVLYVTLEPCPMCASAILYSRIPNIYFGAFDPLYGAFGSALDLRHYIKFNPQIIGGVQEESCSKLIKEYFLNKRQNIND
jgi:tRNA(adenine34) deaminase